MKRHILTHISDISCKLCHMKFLTNEELDDHMRKHEENPHYRLLKKKVILYLTQVLNIRVEFHYIESLSVVKTTKQSQL